MGAKSRMRQNSVKLYVFLAPILQTGSLGPELANPATVAFAGS
jgi:hypothetical protein